MERLKAATGEIMTPTDSFNFGMHHSPYTESSFFPPQAQHVSPDNRAIQMAQFPSFQSNISTGNQPLVASPHQHTFSEMMHHDSLGRLQGLDISGRNSRLVKSEAPSISASESSRMF